MKRLILILTLILGVSQLSFSQEFLQEVVYLKNGSIIRGVIIEQVPNESLKIKTSDGSIFVYTIPEIQKITKEEPIQPNFKRRKTFNGFADNTKGYKGFVNLTVGGGLGDYGDNNIGLSTSHGYQFNPYIYLGAGVGLSYYFDYETTFVPIFLDFKANLMDGKIIPFAGAKLGYSVFDGTGFYFNPTVGVKFAKSFNVSLGYTVQMTEMYYYDYNGGYSNSYYDNVNIGGLSLSFGFEF